MSVDYLRKMMAKADHKAKSKQKSFGDFNKVVNIPYIDDGQRGHLLDVMKPVGKGNGITLLYIHGGAYIYGWKENESTFCSFFVDNGFTVISINYRLASCEDNVYFKDQVRDVIAALQFIHDNADEYDISLKNFCLMGDSAGGHLSLMIDILYHDQEARDYYGIKKMPEIDVKAYALNSTMYDYASLAPLGAKYLSKKALKAMFSPSYNDKDYLKFNSPSYYFAKKIPSAPLFNSTSYNDIFKSQSIRMKKDCDEYGYDLTYLFENSYKKQIGHVYNHMVISEPESIKCNNAMIDFFIKHASN